MTKTPATKRRFFTWVDVVALILFAAALILRYGWENLQWQF